jgi:hypothetical protein
VDGIFAGLLFVLADLSTIAGLIIGLCRGAGRLAAIRGGGDRQPPARARVMLIAMTATLALVLAANGWVLFWISNPSPGITSAQAVGTWTESDGGGGLTVRLLPGGTFTAEGLPPDVDNASPNQAPVPIPADEQGTWQITRPGQDDGEAAIVCSLAGGPQFQLTFGMPPTLGSPPEGEFTYLQGQFSEPTVYILTRH